MKTCSFCNKEFRDTFALHKHLERKTLCIDVKLLHEQYTQLKENKPITNSIVESVVNSHNNIVTINVNINPVSKLALDHIPPNKLKDFIESYKGENLNLLLSDYIKDIICNKNHPENHSVKYIKKKPPTYNSLIEKDGETINVIKGLKDTCELLTDPILDKLKIKLREFLKKYKKDEDFDYDLFEDTIQQLRKELNKDNVKKALSSVLQNDILNTIEMKFNLKINEAQV